MCSAVPPVMLSGTAGLRLTCDSVPQPGTALLTVAPADHLPRTSLAQVAQHDREYLQAYLAAAAPLPEPLTPTSQSQLLAALALRNTLPVRCR
jgi:hypothetical protein